MSLAVADLTDDGTEVAVPIRYVTGARAVAVRIRIALGTIRGTWPPDQLLGLPLTSWTRRTPQVVIAGQVRAQLGRIPGVLEVVSVEVSPAAGRLRVAVVCRIADDTGTAVVRVLAPDETPTPGPWYTLVTGQYVRPVAPVRY